MSVDKIPEGKVQMVSEDGKRVIWVDPPKTAIDQLFDKIQLLESRVYDLEGRVWRMETGGAGGPK